MDEVREVMRLKNRSKSIPNGNYFVDQTTGWDSRQFLAPFPSFNVLVNAVVAHRRGNKALFSQANVSMDRASVEYEVDSYLAAICHSKGYTEFYADGGSAPPKALPPLQRLRAVAAGAKTLVEWITSGSEAAPQEQAEIRSSVCSVCPKNTSGSWESFFTVPVSESIKEQVEKRKSMNLSTTHDESLGVCEACLCPLKLMIHVPLEKKLKHMSKEAFDALDENCWVRSEKAQLDRVRSNLT